MSDWARLLAPGVVLLLISIAGATQAAQRAGSRPAVPAEPIAAILDAFRTHQVVALDEGNHGNQQGHAFRLALIRDPRFAATVNDIVVEFGNSRYQDVMDRFVGGDDVPLSHDDLLGEFKRLETMSPPFHRDRLTTTWSRRADCPV
jgi:hypothetical protein